jgi:hypothetical protein
MIQAHLHESTPRNPGRPEFRCCQRQPVCVSCIVLVRGSPRSIRWASTISRGLQPRGTLRCSCGSALYGMPFRNDGQRTRHDPWSLVNRKFRSHVATGAECSTVCHGAASRLFAFYALGIWSPRQAQLSHRRARSATRFTEDSPSLLLRVAGGFSLSISHASGAWPSEMKPRGGSSRYAAGDGHMTKVTNVGRRRLCTWPAETRKMWTCPTRFRRQCPVGGVVRGDKPDRLELQIYLFRVRRDDLRMKCRQDHLLPRF